MCDLTIVNPTKNPFNIGTNINQPCIIDIDPGVYVQVGNGNVVTFTYSEIIANGDYSVAGNSGIWSIQVIANDDNTYNVDVALTGAISGYSLSFTATCTSGAGTVVLQDEASANKLAISQDNGSWLTDGRIEFNASWVPIDVYADSNV